MKVFKFSVLAMAFVALALTSCGPHNDLIPVTGITIEEAIEVSNVAPVELIATVTPGDATTKLTWESSNPNVVTVVSSGDRRAIVNYVGVGEATITAKADGVTSNDCVVTSKFVKTYPDLPAPGAGKVTIAIRAANACNGLYLAGVKGAYPGTTEGVMTKVEGDWYQITGDVADFVGYNMKAMLVPNGGDAPTYDYEWADNASGSNIVILEGTGVTLGNDYGTKNALNVTEDANNSVIYVTVEAFKKSPCIADIPYAVSIKVPEMCAAAGSQVYIIGGFAGSSWGTAIAMTKDGNVWKATINAQENTEFKVRASEADWTIEVQQFKIRGEDTEASWGGADNLKLTDNLSPVFDLSDAAVYRWNVCAE